MSTKIKPIKEENLLKKEGVLGGFWKYSSYLTVAVIILGLFRIDNKDLKTLYSLLMIIAAAVGRYGVDLIYHITKYKPDYSNRLKRNYAYAILWLVGVLGLLF